MPGAHVLATVVAHRRGRKLRVFTYKPKKRHRRTLGYRSQLTELLVEEVAPGGGKPTTKRAEKPAAAPSAPATTEPEPAAEAEADAVGEVPEAAAEAKPAKRAARPRKKADGA